MGIGSDSRQGRPAPAVAAATSVFAAALCWQERHVSRQKPARFESQVQGRDGMESDGPKRSRGIQTSVDTAVILAEP